MTEKGEFKFFLAPSEHKTLYSQNQVSEYFGERIELDAENEGYFWCVNTYPDGIEGLYYDDDPQVECQMK